MISGLLDALKSDAPRLNPLKEKRARELLEEHGIDVDDVLRSNQSD